MADAYVQVSSEWAWVFFISVNLIGEIVVTKWVNYVYCWYFSILIAFVLEVFEIQYSIKEMKIEDTYQDFFSE